MPVLLPWYEERSGISDSGDFADPVIVGVTDIDRPVGCDRCPMRPVERGGLSRPAVAIAGSGRQGGDGDGGPARDAGLDRPHGAAVAADGSIYIGDTNNHRIRKVARA